MHDRRMWKMCLIAPYTHAHKHAKRINNNKNDDYYFIMIACCVIYQMPFCLLPFCFPSLAPLLFALSLSPHVRLSWAFLSRLRAYLIPKCVICFFFFSIWHNLPQRLLCFHPNRPTNMSDYVNNHKWFRYVNQDTFEDSIYLKTRNETTTKTKPMLFTSNHSEYLRCVFHVLFDEFC